VKPMNTASAGQDNRWTHVYWFTHLDDYSRH